MSAQAGSLCWNITMLNGCNMNTFQKIDACLRALAGVDEWDIKGCPFCGKRQEDKYGYRQSNHEEDCPVKLAQEILD